MNSRAMIFMGIMVFTIFFRNSDFETTIFGINEFGIVVFVTGPWFLLLIMI